MEEREKLAYELMRECASWGEPVTYEEALEMADMEIKAMKMKRYEHAETAGEKPKVKREVKIDTEKVEILKIIKKALTDAGIPAIIVSEQKEITFGDYSVTLTKHRKKK